MPEARAAVMLRARTWQIVQALLTVAAILSQVGLVQDPWTQSLEDQIRAALAWFAQTWTSPRTKAKAVVLAQAVVLVQALTLALAVTVILAQLCLAL